MSLRIRLREDRMSDSRRRKMVCGCRHFDSKRVDITGDQDNENPPVIRLVCQE